MYLCMKYTKNTAVAEINDDVTDGDDGASHDLLPPWLVPPENNNNNNDK